MTATEGLTFDEATHAYRLNGSPVPSVTQVIGSVLPGWQAGDWYLQRGRALHHGCRLLDEGTLDWASVSPEILNRVRAWQTFRLEWLDVEVIASELPMASATHRYAGTVDRVFGTITGDAIIDLKSTIEPQVRCQLSAYAALWEERTGRVVNSAAAVELRDDGTYRTLWMNKFQLRLARQTFLACLTVHNFKTLHKIGESNGR